MSYIYKITNNHNDKVYIGMTNHVDPYQRWKQHKWGLTSVKNGVKKNPSDLQLEMIRLGIDSFEFEVIEECHSSVVDEREVFWINEYNSHKNGYNMVTPREKWGSYTPKKLCKNKWMSGT